MRRVIKLLSNILFLIIGVLIGGGAVFFIAALHAKSMAAVIAKLKFAFINKDSDYSHSFENYVLIEADKIINDYGGMEKLLKYSGADLYKKG